MAQAPAQHFAQLRKSHLPLQATATQAIVWGDVDGDGDLDLVAGVLGQNELLLNDGSGTFSNATAGHLPAIIDQTWQLALADADGDGDLDLLVANAGTYNPATYTQDGEQSRFYLNDGNGVFTDATADWLPTADRVFWSLAFTDFDGDQDPDVFFAEMIPPTSGVSTYYTNTYRQLHTPHRLRAGQPFQVDAYSHGTPPGVTTFALPFLSLRRVSIPMPPFGTLGIMFDLGLGSAAVSPTTGIASLTWNVPNLPVVAGLEVFAQAVVWSTNGEVRLTNVTRDVGIE